MTDLFKTTIELLNNTNMSVEHIARESNVGYRWLCKLKAGEYSDPGVNKVQRVHNFLTEQIRSAA
jgi:hypothetical protein